MKHSKWHPLLIPLIISVCGSFCIHLFSIAFLFSCGITSWGGYGNIWHELFISFQIAFRRVFCSKVNMCTNNKIRQENEKRHIRAFSNNKFVLGGWTAFGSGVCMRLVTNSHLHGKPQAFLVNSPVEIRNDSVRCWGGLQCLEYLNRPRSDLSHPMCVTASRFS